MLRAAEERRGTTNRPPPGAGTEVINRDWKHANEENQRKNTEAQRQAENEKKKRHTEVGGESLPKRQRREEEQLPGRDREPRNRA